MTPDARKAYAATLLEIYFDGLFRIDLRAAVSERTRADLADAGLREEFWVVTACNPAGRKLSDGENHERSEKLETNAAGLAARFLRADGVAADGSHRERGVAIKTSREAALELARSYQQLAVYRFDGERFWIVPTDPAQPDLALPQRSGQ